MKLNSNSKSIVAVCAFAALVVVCLLVGLDRAKAGTPPIWKQERTLAAAAPLCADNRGVYQIRPNAQGNYWLTCQDSTMIRVKIKVSKNAVALAAL